MNETELVVEYKTTGELFSRKFAYTRKFEDIEGIIIYMNDNRAMELELRKKYLEWSINRPMYENEEF